MRRAPLSLTVDTFLAALSVVAASGAVAGCGKREAAPMSPEPAAQSAAATATAATPPPPVAAPPPPDPAATTTSSATSNEAKRPSVDAGRELDDKPKPGQAPLPAATATATAGSPKPRTPTKGNKAAGATCGASSCSPDQKKGN